MTTQTATPEVWIDYEHGECFWAWGHHDKPAMMAGAQAHIRDTEGPWEDYSYKEDLEHSPAERLWAYTEDGSDPEDAEQFWISKEPAGNFKAITRLQW